LAGRETPVGQPHDIAGCHVELAWAVVRSGVDAYILWRRYGYVRADGSVDREFYWHQWKQRAINKTPSKKAVALHTLNDVAVDAQFVRDGLYWYLKILGHEKQFDWLHEEIATRVAAEAGSRAERGRR